MVSTPDLSRVQSSTPHAGSDRLRRPSYESTSAQHPESDPFLRRQNNMKLPRTLDLSNYAESKAPGQNERRRRRIQSWPHPTASSRRSVTHVSTGSLSTLSSDPTHPGLAASDRIAAETRTALPSPSSVCRRACSS